jgi:hypothetical protein
MARKSKFADDFMDYDAEMRKMELEFKLEDRRNKRALNKMTKSADFTPFIEDDRVTPFSDVDDINGTFNGRW